MPATRYGLPTSLTPDLLSQILRYEPRHWRVLHPRLVRECPAVWEDIHISDEDFYAKLYDVLKDPKNRRALKAAAQKERTRKRPLTLQGEIRKYYAKQLRTDPSFSDRLRENPSAMELVETLADCGDDDRLANVVWVLAEDECLTYTELTKIAGDYTGIRERLRGTVTGIDMEPKPVAQRWVECLARMKGTLETAERHGPDSDLAACIASYSDALRELAVESEQQRSIQIRKLEGLIDKHRDVLSDHDSLRPYIRMLEDRPPVHALPDDASELVEDLDRRLASLARIADSILRKTGAMGEANADGRRQLVKQIVEIQKQENDTRSDTEQLLVELFPGTPLDGDTETPVAVVDAGGSRTPDDGGDSDASVVMADDIEALVSKDMDHPAAGAAVQRVEEETVSHEPTARDIEVVDVPLPTDATGQPAGDVSEGMMSVGDKAAVTPGSELAECKEKPGADPAGAREPPAAKNGDDGTLETSPVRTPLPHRDGADSSDSVLGTPHRNPTPSDASEALDEMLRTGRFARAYWLARADDSLGTPELLGSLCEGARIGPGDPCPGILAQFFDGLNSKDSWTEGERLLLSAAVLGPCLFVDPLPQGIYQLANRLPIEGSPLKPLMQHVRDLCIYQNTKIRPEDLGGEPADTARNARLDDLRRQARDFLLRVPHIHFTYPPADHALRYLYRAGSDWHRLHVIIRDNRNDRFKEARALAKTLDPANVAGSLHDEKELAALTKPLVGRARDKLARHLHDTIGLAREWIRLTGAGKGDEHRNRSRADELLRALEKLLPVARSTLGTTGASGPVHALHGVLADIEAHLQGQPVKPRPTLSGDLILLPNLPLDSDLEPIDSHLDELRRAILDAEQTEPKPKAVFEECLDRQEYHRAWKILELHELGAQAHKDYQQAVKDTRSMLEVTLNDVEIEIEDAFLLGQLRENTEGVETADRSDHGVLERSQLLSVIRETKAQLHEMSEPEAHGLREIAVAVQEVSAKVERMASSRREKLRREFDGVMVQLSETEQGQSDKNYLRQAFQECIENNDDVAAFELLDRGQRAAQNREPVARASTGSSEALERFLERANGYREALAERGRLSQTEKEIRGGTTVAGIAFGQLDAQLRNEAAGSLRIWSSLLGVRFPNAPQDLRRAMDTLLRFIGLPLKTNGVEVVDATEEGFAHIRASLTRPVSSSPLPAFGSTCGTCFEVAVTKTRKEPEQIEEYIRGRGLADKPVLVYLLRPHSLAYRRRWQRHCARKRLTALPLDLTLFLHLCGERNRLAALLEIGLPFTWSRPYITKGENIADEMFVGRSNEADALMDPMGSCIVFGGRQLGKSALLRHVHRKNHHPGRSTYVIYLDVDDLGSDPQGHDAMTAVFWRRIYDELRRHGALPSLPAKVLSRESRLPEKVPQSIETSLSENENMRVVLLLDESDDFLDCDSSRDFALVRRLRGLMASTARRFKVVFAGLQSVQRYNNWKNHPFAQLGSEVVVNPLPPAAAQDLIIRPFRALGFAFENTSLILRILSQTNYHPGLIQIFCYRLLENLYERWQRQKLGVANQRIKSDDILGVERDAAVMEDIRNRFDWTLDLDDRYKVLTYALVLTPDPTTPHLEAEFMAIGASWWPAVFETMDAQGLRAVLDEMVGLGVLLKDHEEGTRYSYRLRSPNLLRLLGPREAIESELMRIIERDQINRTNPRSYHPIIDRTPIAFGPLTNEQQGQISGHLRPFHLSVITGSEALGIDRVGRQIDRLLTEASKGEGSKAWKKVKHLEPIQADSLIRKLQETFRPRGRDHRYAVIRLREVEFEGRLSTLFDRFVRELGNFCTSESKGHLLILLDPYETWRWLGDEYRERVLGQPRVTGLELRRWSDGAITNALDQIGARTGSKIAARDVFERTSGFHRLVNDGLRRAIARHDRNAQNLVVEWNELCGEMLTENGLDTALTTLGLRGSGRVLEECVWQVLRLAEERNGVLVLVDTSFDLASEEVSEEGRSLLEDGGIRIREWMRTMDLARPGGTHEDGEMVVASWVQEAVKMKIAEA